MAIKFVHVNIIAKDWKRLAKFYQDVFGCTPVNPERNLSGEWIEKGTAIPGAEIKGVHLKLPGYGDDGPTLEIFQYNKNKPRNDTVINCEDLTHIAFSIDDVEKTRDAVLEEGGKLIGEIVTVKIPGAGNVTFLYLTDPEGNIIEIQKWS